MDVRYIITPDYEIWNKFCKDHRYATFMHTSYAMEYYINCSFNIKSKQRSFFVFNNDILVACVPLFVETIDEKNYLSYGGASLPNPLVLESLSGKNKKRCLKFIFDKIDEIACEENCIKLDITIAHLSSEYISKNGRYNYLLEYGNFLDKSGNTCLIDLSLSKEALFNSFSGGHRQHTKKSINLLDIEVIDFNNVTKEDVDNFMNYYFEVTGKVTRPVDTFNNIYTWIKNKYAVLFKAKLDSKNICGYSIFYIYKDTAYYAMACKKKEYSDMYVSHFIQWNSMIYLKETGVRYYEIGVQDFNDSIGNFITEKDKNISTYKREFGGFIIPAFKAEKFYDKKEFIKYYEERIHTYAERNFPGEKLE